VEDLIQDCIEMKVDDVEMSGTYVLLPLLIVI